MVTERNISIDVAKGGLILLVIAGHVMNGTLEDKVLRFIIYSFHMQFFLFISGWLVNIDKLASLTPMQLFFHYARRMLGWWLLAWFVFTAYDIHNSDITPGLVAYKFLNPYYHLWYVPTLFTLICIAYLARKALKDDRAFFSVLAALSIATFIAPYWVKTPSLFGLPSLIWFFLGLACRNMNMHKLKNINGGGYLDNLYYNSSLRVLANKTHRRIPILEINKLSLRHSYDTFMASPQHEMRHIAPCSCGGVHWAELSTNLSLAHDTRPFPSAHSCRQASALLFIRHRNAPAFHAIH